MSFRDFSKWNTRAALLYALGAWTLIGSLGYYTYMGFDIAKGVVNEEEPDNPNRVVHKTPHTSHVIVYKENFVPYTTRISNFFNSSSSSDEPGTRSSGK